MNNKTKTLMLAALFVAIGLVLPNLVTMSIPEIGRMLLPMHLPVLFCGLICGRKYGLIVGFILPLMRSFMFGLPVLFPMAIAMAFELATYGLVIGIVYNHIAPRKNIVSLLYSLIAAMIAGRAVWGTAMALLLGFSGGYFTWQLFIAGAFVNALPGIAIQLVLIPAVMFGLDRSGLVRFGGES